MKADNDLNKFLEASSYINWKDPKIKELSDSLAVQVSSENALVKICFEWVRDNIKHSAEYKLNPITCKASDVLKHKTGYCFAKSHLLAAILRANAIPTGLCYQRLSLDDVGAPYSLHGLNAVYLKEFGWYRIDPRGNNNKVNAQFVPPREQLAYPIRLKDEIDLPEIWTEPMPMIVDVLEKYETYQDVNKNLPDLHPSSIG